MAEPGLLAMPDDYFGVAIAVDGKLSQWAYLFLDFSAQKNEETPAPAAVPLPTRKQPVS